MAHILVVDDEADMRLALTNVLSRSGHRVSEAPEGDSALAFLSSERPDLMLLDMRLPGMDGIQILKRVKELHPELPVVMVTGYGSVDSAIEVMRLGASHYLAKPFSNKELVESVERILHARRVPVVAGRPESGRADEPAGPLVPSRPAPLALPGPEGVPTRDFAWGLAAAAAAALLAWPLLAYWRSPAREFSTTLAHPSALAWEGDRLWTADWMSQTVYEQELRGGELKVLRATSLPQTRLMGLALSKDFVYVADDWRREIQRRRRDANLTLDRAVRSPGPRPSSLHFDGQYLWSADSANQTIYQHALDDALTVIQSYRGAARNPVALYKDDKFFWSADGENRVVYRHRLDSKLTVLATYLWPQLNEGSQALSCFTLRGGSAWVGREGVERLYEVPLKRFQVTHASR